MLKLRHPEFTEGRSLSQRNEQLNNYPHRIDLSSHTIRQAGFNTNALLVDAAVSGRMALRWTKKYGYRINQIIRRHVFGLFVISFSALQFLPTELVESKTVQNVESADKEFVFVASVKAAEAPVFQRPVSGDLSQGFWHFHPAIDIPNPYGTKVKPVDEGIVVYSGWEGGFGYSVVIKHKAEFSSRYAHLAKVKVKKGQNVDKQTIIGLVGATGVATGSHLHLELYRDGKNIDPQKFLPKNR